MIEKVLMSMFSLVIVNIFRLVEEVISDDIICCTAVLLID